MDSEKEIIEINMEDEKEVAEVNIEGEKEIDTTYLSDKETLMQSIV